MRAGLWGRLRRLRLEDGGFGVDAGDGFRYGFEFVGVARTAAGKEFDLGCVFDRKDAGITEQIV